MPHCDKVIEMTSKIAADLLVHSNVEYHVHESTQNRCNRLEIFIIICTVHLHSELNSHIPCNIIFNRVGSRVSVLGAMDATPRPLSKLIFK